MGLIVKHLSIAKEDQQVVTRNWSKNVSKRERGVATVAGNVISSVLCLVLPTLIPKPVVTPFFNDSLVLMIVLLLTSKYLKQSSPAAAAAPLTPCPIFLQKA
uniref:Uncharacterized protein n=1 Tax=Romanomermis culicivorax TaxID=13658 RepID=A0A915JYJ3_ROMCU